jgi:hypothetical protein
VRVRREPAAFAAFDADQELASQDGAIAQHLLGPQGDMVRPLARKSDRVTSPRGGSWLAHLRLVAVHRRTDGAGGFFLTGIWRSFRETRMEKVVGLDHDDAGNAAVRKADNAAARKR